MARDSGPLIYLHVKGDMAAQSRDAIITSQDLFVPFDCQMDNDGQREALVRNFESVI